MRGQRRIRSRRTGWRAFVHPMVGRRDGRICQPRSSRGVRPRARSDAVVRPSCRPVSEPVADRNVGVFQNRHRSFGYLPHRLRHRSCQKVALMGEIVQISLDRRIPDTANAPTSWEVQRTAAFGPRCAGAPSRRCAGAPGTCVGCADRVDHSPWGGIWCSRSRISPRMPPKTAPDSSANYSMWQIRYYAVRRNDRGLRSDVNRGLSLVSSGNPCCAHPSCLARASGDYCAWGYGLAAVRKASV